MATYFTSDPHLFHEKVALLRGFEDTDTWTQHWVDVYSRTVSQKDTIWILGDMTSGAKIAPMLDLMSALPGRKMLIAGNHDPVHPTHRDFAKHMRAYHEVFTAVAPPRQLNVAWEAWEEFVTLETVGAWLRTL